MFDPVSYALARRAMNKPSGVTWDDLKAELWPNLVDGELGWGEIITNFNTANMITGVSGSGSVSFGASGMILKTGGTASSYAWAKRALNSRPNGSTPAQIGDTTSKFIVNTLAFGSTADNPYTAYFAVGNLIEYKTTANPTPYIGFKDEGTSTSSDVYLVYMDPNESTSEQATSIYSGTYGEAYITVTFEPPSTWTVKAYLTGSGESYTLSHDFGSSAGSLKVYPLQYYIEDGTNASNASLTAYFANWAVIPG